MKIACIIQARLGSTRLPCKVMLDISGKPLLSILLHQVSQSSLINQIIVATTTLPQDDVISDYCHELDIDCFRGPSDNVLERYRQAALHFNADIIVRITADCPLIDPAIIDLAIQTFLDQDSSCELVTNRFPLTYIDGMDVDMNSNPNIEQQV